MCKLIILLRHTVCTGKGGQGYSFRGSRFHTQTMKQYNTQVWIIRAKGEREGGGGREREKERERERQSERGVNSLTYDNHLHLVPHCRHALPQYTRDTAPGAGGGQEVSWGGKSQPRLRDWLLQLIKPPVCVCVWRNMIGGWVGLLSAVHRVHKKASLKSSHAHESALYCTNLAYFNVYKLYNQIN